MSTVNEETQPRAALTLTVPETARILIVCDNDSDTERLNTAFREAGLTSESANSMTAGCALAKSGRFRVVFSAPILRDGSWRRLIEVATQHNLGFEIVLLARTFTFNEWAEGCKSGHSMSWTSCVTSPKLPRRQGALRGHFS